jgi:hypothetical protein
MRKKKEPFVTERAFRRFYRRKVKITLNKLDRDTILIEGNRTAFEFLGEMFLAHAKSVDCGFEISPKGAGRYYFSTSAKLGIYLHRLPCTDDEIDRRKRASKTRSRC